MVAGLSPAGCLTVPHLVRKDRQDPWQSVVSSLEERLLENLRRIASLCSEYDTVLIVHKDRQRSIEYAVNIVRVDLI
jgi:hypothetical protein